MSVQQKWGWPVWVAAIAGVIVAFRYEYLWLSPMLYWIRRHVESFVSFIFD